MYSSTSHDTFVICDGLLNVECGRGRGGEVWKGNTQSQMVNVSCDVLLGIGLDFTAPPNMKVWLRHWSPSTTFVVMLFSGEYQFLKIHRTHFTHFRDINV